MVRVCKLVYWCTHRCGPNFSKIRAPLAAPIMAALTALIILAAMVSIASGATVTVRGVKWKPNANVSIAIAVPPGIPSAATRFTLVSSSSSGKWGNVFLTRTGSRLIGVAVTPPRTGHFDLVFNANVAASPLLSMPIELTCSDGINCNGYEQYVMQVRLFWGSRRGIASLRYYRLTIPASCSLFIL